MANKARQAELISRRTKAIAMRIRGATWETIAQECGYNSYNSAFKDVSNELKRRSAEQALALEQLREHELAKLDAMDQQVWTVLERRHLTIQHGKVVSLDDEPVEDDEHVLRAVDRLLKIADRRARLLGVDAPEKVDVSSRITYQFEGIDSEQLK